MYSSLPLVKGLNVINSRTGGGKSTIAMSMASEWIRGGGRVFYLFHEERPVEMVFNMLACNYGVSVRKLKDGLFKEMCEKNPESIQSLLAKISMRSCNVRDDESQYKRTLSMAECLVGEDLEEGDLLIVDYITELNQKDNEYLLNLGNKGKATVLLFCQNAVKASAAKSMEKLSLDSMMVNDDISLFGFQGKAEVRVFGSLMARYKTSFHGSNDACMFVFRVDNIPLYDGYQSGISKYFVSHANLQTRSTMVTCMELTPEAWYKLRECLILLK